MNQPPDIGSEAQVEALKRQINFSNSQKIEPVEPQSYRNINLRTGTYVIFEKPHSVYPHIISGGSLIQSPTTNWHLNREKNLSELEKLLRGESSEKPSDLIVYKFVEN